MEKLGYYQDTADPTAFLTSGIFPIPKAFFLNPQDLEAGDVDIIAPHLEAYGLPTGAISDAIEAVMRDIKGPLDLEN